MPVFSVFLFLLLATVAQAQNPVMQSGNITTGHAVQWTTNGVIQDAGAAASGSLTSIGVTASGPAICQNSDVITAAGWQTICLGVTTAGGATITVTNSGTATALPLSISGTKGFQVPTFTFASLSTCTTGLQGTLAMVSDSTTVTWGATIAGGSTSKVLAFCNGTNWTVAGK